MFYYKHNDEKIKIQEDQFFTICPICNREHQIDLADIIMTAGEHFKGLDYMAVFCKRCSAIREIMD